MSDKKTIAEQQLEDLRVLHDLLASGEVSAKDFKEQKARIMNQRPGPVGTPSGGGGASGGGGISGGISVRQLNRRTGLPGHIKLLIVLGLLSTLAVTLYLTIDLSIFLDAYEDPNAEPTVQPTIVATPPGGASSPAPPSQVSANTSGGADDVAVSANWLRDEEAAAPAPPPPEAPPEAPSGDAPPAPTGPRLDWPVRFDDYAVPPEHPFHQWCDSTKLIRSGQVGALIGVTVGPKALSLDDPIYLDFCKQTQEALTGQYGTRDGEESERFISGMPMMIAGLPADRCVLIPPRSMGMNAVVTTVRDGRCYAYWFEGPRALYRHYIGTVGRAVYTE